MDIKDALTITALGIGVVFFGLLLTNLMIYSFSLIPRITGLFKKKKPAAAPGQTEVTTEAEPEIIAVITAVLEVEFRKQALLEGKFTFR